MVLTACGPYTPSDSLAYDPLIDLINVISRDRPHVCILVRTSATLSCGGISVLTMQVWTMYMYNGNKMNDYFTFFPQFGPFVDSKHEQIEVNPCLFIYLLWFVLISLISFLICWCWNTLFFGSFEQKGQVTDTFESIFTKCVNSIVEGTRGYELSSFQSLITYLSFPVYRLDC